MKKILFVIAAFSVMLSAGSVNAFTHNKLLKDLGDAAETLEQQLKESSPEAPAAPSQGITFPEAPAAPSIKNAPIKKEVKNPDYQKGMTAAESGDFATALREWTPLAEQGNAAAQSSIARLYVYGGQGVPQDYKTAAKWYILAAEQGYAPAQFNLGVHYRKGEGVPQDYKTAAKWWKLAAEQGHVKSQYNLGFMYNKGQGVQQDDKTAVKWYRLAAEQGHAGARKNLNILIGQGFDGKSDVLAAEQSNSFSKFEKITKRISMQCYSESLDWNFSTDGVNLYWNNILQPANRADSVEKKPGENTFISRTPVSETYINFKRVVAIIKTTGLLLKLGPSTETEMRCLKR
jgi:hypothetical protein